MAYKHQVFRSQLSEDIFNNKYKHDGCETWGDLAYTLTRQVCGPFLSKEEVSAIYEIIRDMKFLPGGRYLYYAGRDTSSLSAPFREISSDTPLYTDNH